MQAIFIIIAAVLMLPAIAMPLVPMVPALPYLFVVAFGFALIDGFSALTLHELLILLVFVIVSVVVDQSAGLIGAKYGGAHGKSLLWGIGGALLGTFMFPPFGGFLGLFIAVFCAELYYMKTHKEALKAASSALIGTATGVIINIFLAVAFISTFIFFVTR